MLLPPLDQNAKLSRPPSHEPALTLPTMSWDCGLRYVFMPPVLQLSGVCALRGGGGGGGGGEELTSRLGLETVQRLAKDGCRLLQNHNYRLSDRNQAVS